MTLHKNDHRRPTVGDRVRIDADDEPHYGKVGTIIEDDGSTLPYSVQFEDGGGEWFYPREVSVVPDGDTLPGEADTTTTARTTITTTTQITLPRPATAKQVADALAHVDGHHEVNIRAYAGRIEIHAHHK